MIIKKWNSGTSSWVAQSPKVNAADIVVDIGAGTLVSIFGGGTSSPKILPAYLPDSVFDSLFFAGSTIGSIGSAPSRGVLASDLITKLYEADAAGRSIVGYYWVITSAGTITGLTGIQESFIVSGEPGDGEYATLQFKPQDGGTNTSANTSSGTLEAGDWFVIEAVSGNGTSNTPWVFTASVINNSFEVFTGATASVAGTAGIVPGAAAGQQLSFLRGDGSWAVPTDTNTTYTAGTGLTLSGTEFQHADTSTAGSSSNSGRTYIQSITVDGFGHVTAISTATETVTDTNTTYTAGSGLTLTGTSFSHTDTSSASNLTASSRTYVTGLTFDTYGHVTGYTTGTETVTDTNTTYSAGNGISLSGTAFSVAAGVGLTQEASGLKMSQPHIAGTATPGASYQVADTIWFDLN